MDEGKGGLQRIVGRDEMENLDHRPADGILVHYLGRCRLHRSYHPRLAHVEVIYFGRI